MPKSLPLACGLVLAVALFDASAARAEPPAPRVDVRSNPNAAAERPRPPAPILLSVDIVPDPPAAKAAQPTLTTDPRPVHVAVDGRPPTH